MHGAQGGGKHWTEIYSTKNASRADNLEKPGGLIFHPITIEPCLVHVYPNKPIRRIRLQKFNLSISAKMVILIFNKYIKTNGQICVTFDFSRTVVAHPCRPSSAIKVHRDHWSEKHKSSLCTCAHGEKDTLKCIKGERRY